MVFVTGKHYYALARHAEEGSGGLPNVAFVRLEQLCPFPTKELQEAVAPFKRAKSEYTVGERERESESPQSPPIFTSRSPLRVRVEPGGASQHGRLAVCRAPLQGLDAMLS